MPLKAQIEIADLVKKQGSATGRLELTFLRVTVSVNAPFRDRTGPTR